MIFISSLTFSQTAPSTTSFNVDNIKTLKVTNQVGSIKVSNTELLKESKLTTDIGTISLYSVTGFPERAEPDSFIGSEYKTENYLLETHIGNITFK